ncbi:YrvL family regulatory protein [Alkalihalobacillus trypoxylicola]|uniref:Regulatory protein YrvL n=1 Tax=Alkalihalobacillus trypoxylicola TaxID=519424 RepID=A0A162DCZ7_9BACI|nr:YrvL family regulatory protein [Alkalihalobacillus trypoxylicola]KYG29226.1 hypothetical protein AZF04_06795 [Alkalihalobacillus trypoxylicola]
MSDDRNTKELNISLKILIICLFVLLIAGTILFVFSLYYLGMAGLFTLLGISYDSLRSLFLFVILYFVLSFFGDILAKTILGLAITTNKIAEHKYMPFSFFVYFVINWAVISSLNFIMDSINIDWPALIVLSAFIAAVEVALSSYFQTDKPPTKK